ncbi:MAG: iron-sulfur cluster insertion protein ErpA [Candidatus Wallbacteria bacterium]|nr:iron-sulfur cluster insertion protein ErpA [Candidatus Wallbacteria bacterium]
MRNRVSRLPLSGLCGILTLDYSGNPAVPPIRYRRCEVLTLTENAIKKLREFRAADASLAGKSLRISIEGGGCSGFQYGMTFDDSHDGDQVIQAAEDVGVLLDPNSFQYLQDSKIDYIESLTGSGFSIANPNAKSSCGCGQSFNV